MRTRAKPASVFLAALAASALVGCAGGSNVGAIRSSPTPELMNVAETPDQIANKLALTRDYNLRMISEDAARVLMIDRPSRLSPAPIPR
jgi:type IV pilus biogenesis protein CpaD/CtpE